MRRSPRAGAAGRRLVARAIVAHALDLHVVGLEYVPPQGPVILAARHYHHLYDACAILASLPREVHVMIAVDWLTGPRLALMRYLARLARWPIVWRTRARRRPLNRDGFRSSLEVLSQGGVMLVFPEAYPTIDPLASYPRADDALLPFDPAFLILAERTAGTVAIIPAGLWYSSCDSQAWLRFGAPIGGAARKWDRERRLAEVETAVRALSAPQSD